jgi:hypothetical protein
MGSSTLWTWPWARKMQSSSRQTIGALVVEHTISNAYISPHHTTRHDTTRHDTTGCFYLNLTLMSTCVRIPPPSTRSHHAWILFISHSSHATPPPSQPPPAPSPRFPNFRPGSISCGNDWLDPPCSTPRLHRGTYVSMRLAVPRPPFTTNRSVAPLPSNYCFLICEISRPLSSFASVSHFFFFLNPGSPLVMHGSDCHDHPSTMALQIILVMNSVRIPHSTYSKMLTNSANVPTNDRNNRLPASAALSYSVWTLSPADGTMFATRVQLNDVILPHRIDVKTGVRFFLIFFRIRLPRVMHVSDRWP